MNGVPARLAAVGAVSTLLACSGNTLSGTIEGVPFSAADAFFVAGEIGGGDLPSQYTVTLFVENPAGSCAALQHQGYFLPNVIFVQFDWGKVSGTASDTVTPGSYSVAAGEVSAGATKLSNCLNAFDVFATTGTVDVQAFEGNLLAGTVSNVVFGTSGSVSGSFSAPYCDLSNLTYTGGPCTP